MFMADNSESWGWGDFGRDMTDIQILGLKGPCSYEELKQAYRNKSKELHPDKNTDKLNSHLAMIRLNKAYTNLKKNFSETGKGLEKEKKEGKDQAYAIYKDGILKFQNIHPSKWKSYSIDGLFDAGAITTHPEAQLVIETLIADMAEAYRLFSVIVNEHKNSSWYFDSLDKMREIEILTPRYMKIKESYELEMNKMK